MNDSIDGTTILVTGATGFIGRHLLDRLRLVPRAQLVVLSRRPAREGRAGETWVASDCRRLTDAVWRTHGIATIDYVFHLAAETAKGSPDAPADEVYEANVSGTATLLDSLPSLPRRFIVASTLDVYAPIGAGQVLSESSPVRPSGAYANSKLQSEVLVAEAGRARGFTSVVLRYGHIFGPGEQAYRKLIPEAIRRLLTNEPPVVFGDGSTLRDYLYVGDAVEATLRAATVQPAPTGPVNVVRGESCTVRDVIETLRDITGFKGASQYLIDRPGGSSLRFDSRYLQTTLGSWSLVPLKEGLRLEVEDFRIRAA